MWLIVGLGNPGSKYAKTRHNIGFLVLDKFAEDKLFEFREKSGYRICSGSVKDKEIVLLKPLNFMNRSGMSVKKIVNKFNIPPERIILIHDDLDIETGRLKIRRKGSSGGHKGVESVILNIGSADFIRVKIGIGRDEFIPAEEFVLSKFRKDEVPLIREAIEKALNSIDVIITEGIEKAMNRFN